MRLGEIKSLVGSTSDWAYAVDGDGRIIAWNQAAERATGLSAEEVIGKSCGSVIRGTDECGEVCSRDCTVRQAIRHRHPIGNFDLRVPTPEGEKWFNVSVLLADEASVASPCSIHIVRQIDVRKKLEILVRDFVVKETHLPAEQVKEMIATTRASSRQAELTNREQEVLRLLAQGAPTAKIANQLNVSPTTINNHIQHILRKLDAHSRLEAVRRAEHAGLI